MLKRTITYTNYDGHEETEELCFHLSKAELIQMEVELPEGLQEFLTKVSESKDGKLIIKTMKDLILRSYGIRDGNRFRKNAQIREEFESSEAFSELFMELATDGTSAAQFVVGIMPSNLEADLSKIVTTPLPTETKVLTQFQATGLSHEDLIAKLADGYTIESNEADLSR